MLIAIIGTRFSGKNSVEEYLVSQRGFTRVKLLQSHGDMKHLTGELESFNFSSNGDSDTLRVPHSDYKLSELSFLSMSNSALPSPMASPDPNFVPKLSPAELSFLSANDLLTFVTRNWRENYVTVDLHSRQVIELFVKRPFFILVSVDAPLFTRYQRASRHISASLEDFVRADDEVVFGNDSRTTVSLRSLKPLVSVEVDNCFESVPVLYKHLDFINLMDPDRLRPQWDTYFMTLADLASRRSNCMKRRVGAVLVREHRILATGYNGTPRGVLNCNEGGCAHCNVGDAHECVCLHAEENALLEAGRERVGSGAVLYCNTCPCLKCTIKIIQTGVKEVVYNLSYKVDAASAALLNQAGVEIRRFDPHNHSTLERT